ncbi:MAG: hypothetical protein N4A59_03945 [Marinifilum sp.]|jgi:hypothetical protein|nr:hypothetical protein [Marinifilum sp.]
MKNILIVLVAAVFLFVSCGKDSGGGVDPEPTPDYKAMVGKVKSELTNWQSKINNKNFSEAIEFTSNSSNLDFGIYQTSSVESEVADESKFTLTMTEVVEGAGSNVNSGKIILEGKLKITYKDPGSSEVLLNKTFKATINSSGDKSQIHNWKMFSYDILG